MKWLLICIGIYGCQDKPSADDIRAFYTKEECEAEAEVYNSRIHQSYEYRCLEMPKTQSKVKP